MRTVYGKLYTVDAAMGRRWRKNKKGTIAHWLEERKKGRGREEMTHPACRWLQGKAECEHTEEAWANQDRVWKKRRKELEEI
jgi:hypothetical protein